jgi:hypothetical protein
MAFRLEVFCYGRKAEVVFNLKATTIWLHPIYSLTILAMMQMTWLIISAVADR